MNILESELRCNNCWAFETFGADPDSGFEWGCCRLNPPTDEPPTDEHPTLPIVIGVVDYCLQIKPIQVTTLSTEGDQPIIATAIPRRWFHW